MKALLLALAFAATSPALAFSPAVNAAFKGQILVTKDPLAAKKTDKETIAAIKAQRLTKLACHLDTAGTTMATFHVTAFPKAAASGSLELKLNQAAKTLTGNGGEVIETGVQITSDDTVGPALKLELKQGARLLAAGALDAACLKKKAK